MTLRAEWRRKLGYSLICALVTSLVPVASIEGQARPDGRVGPFAVGGSWGGLMDPFRQADPSVVVPDALIGPTRTTGLFWTAGNPAGLAREVEEGWSAIISEWRADTGEYRFPSDPGRSSVSSVDGIGWRPLGAGAVLGGIAISRSRLSEGVAANVLVPDPMSPYLLLDEGGADLEGTRARLHGHGGWPIGPLDIGVGVLYEAESASTVQSPVPRLLRSVVPGAALGVAISPGESDLRFGLHYQHQRRVQTSIVYAVANAGTEYELDGLAEPRAVEVPGGVYQRRVVDVDRSVTVTGAGFLGGVDWALYGRYSQDDEELWYELRVLEPRRDTWASTGWEAGLALRRVLRGGSVRLAGQVTIRSERAEGDRVHRHDDDEVSDERSLGDARGEVWVLPDSGLRIGLRLGIRRDVWERRDPLVFAGVNVSSWTPMVAASVARRIRPGLWLAASAGVASYAPAGQIPEPSALGPRFQEWVAPALALAGSPGSFRSGGLGILWRTREGGSYWLQMHAGSGQPSETARWVAPLGGSRRIISLRVGVILPGPG